MKTKKTYCGEFYYAKDCYVGQVHKLAVGRYVIRGVESFTGRTLWQSAGLTGKEFKLIRTVNLGYARVNCYTAKA